MRKNDNKSPDPAVPLREGAAEGCRSLVVWADVLDRINVFPVADGDTGRNLVLTLAPLQRGIPDREALKTRILASARGNSGNIAARFFCGFLEAECAEGLPAACREGRDLAYGALKNPMQGTILSLFDALVDGLEQSPPGEGGGWASRVTQGMESALLATRRQLPELEAAGVVDAGALGLFLFFRTCFQAVSHGAGDAEHLPQSLKPFLAPAETWHVDPARGYCLDAMVRTAGRGSPADVVRAFG
ncbi:MAG: DAK2 domain-containing protein, partial [Deltaproteobacteria bacterium]|nr:DAK2 domain-containing protein [Deltaproteobacteria bacterium]